ncbi:polyphosphate kinase 2 family protein [Aestuariibacter sp. A3R04]|uniref:polyphosphate kinase 2 family protein n=1 Tax=Aestuariibacter sp. A3R04 TaxID=2841571 RepID=UPI001C08E88C|nr:PPK2 family polyphosphate kinase [Aestuariibacter sp. A3R04]MBU3020542.1 polyphosphate kinase [Aestuariibacter sp. A3R04]
MPNYVSKISLAQRHITLKNIDTTRKLDSKADYKKQLKKWQNALLHTQQAYFHQQKRAIIVFEGWDASGKGGAIRRVTEPLDPRGFLVHPIAAPRKEEQGRHYLYRFQRRLPKQGTIAIFDRSWYGRVLVERVEALATENEWQRAYQEINEFERLLIDDGVRIVKLFMHITPEEQLARFEERLHNPYKRWKLTEEDIRNREKWSQYEEATEAMFDNTDTEAAPWHVIAAEHKWYARVAVLRTLVEELGKEVDISPPPIDDSVVNLARKKLGITGSIDKKS